MWAIVRKDLAIERRTGEMLSSLFLLALLVILLFAFTLEPERLSGASFLAGLLWTTLLLSGTLSLNRSFVLEREAGAWTALGMAPLDRGSIYLGKTVANFLFLLVGALCLLPLLTILLATRGLSPSLLLLASLLLGVMGIAAVGTLFAAMASRTRAREVLLPLLSFPILAPLLIGAARTTAAGLVAEPLEQVGSWLTLLGAFDLVFLTAGWLTFDHVVEE
jgi:heme exporter protein B